MLDWIKLHKEGIIRGMFLVPILAVAVISISHVVSWYDIANPMAWAVYLSIAVEIAAMSAISAASVKVKGFSVWFVFIIVTLIQFIGNIFFSYSEIDVASKSFNDWSELTAPVFESIGSDISDVTGQRRWLAILEGGLLPLISLTCLHFFIEYGELDATASDQAVISKAEPSETPSELPVEPVEPSIDNIEVTEPTIESVSDSSESTISTENEQPVESNPVRSKDFFTKRLSSGISNKIKKIQNK